MYSKCDGGRFHTIKKGDTLYSISRMHNVPLIVLLKANPCLDVYNLQIGDKVCIPMKCDVKGNNIEDDEQSIKEKAMDAENVIKHIEGKEIVKVIVIKGKIVNIVVK